MAEKEEKTGNEQKDTIVNTNSIVIEQKTQDISQDVINVEEPKKKVPISIFITEDNRFEIKVRYHASEDGKGILVENVDDEFDPKDENIEEFNMTFKYPSQRDYALIKGNTNIENINDIFNLEIVRIAVLFRKWTHGNKVDDLDNIHPSLTKAIALKVRDVIKYDGIL